MRWRTVVIVFSLVSIGIAFALGLRSLYMGRPPSEVLKSITVLLIFLLIPILGAIPTLRRRERGLQPERGLSLVVHMVILLLAPVLAGLIYYLAYPSTSLALPLAVLVVAGALLFSFLSR